MYVLIHVMLAVMANVMYKGKSTFFMYNLIGRLYSFFAKWKAIV